MKPFLTILVFAITMSGCSRPGDSGSNLNPLPGPTPNTPNNRTSNAPPVETGGNEKPEEYFARFIYRKAGSCQSKAGVYFQYLSTFHDYLILPERDAQGRLQIAQMNIYLHKDGSYTFDYDELVHAPTRWNDSTYSLQRAIRLLGRWKVQSNGTMEIENIGTAGAMEVNGKPGISFKMEKNIISPGIVGKSVSMILVSGTPGVDLKAIDVCP